MDKKLYPRIGEEVIWVTLDNGLPVFTELNLVRDGYAENMAKAAAKNLPLFLSSTMLSAACAQNISPFLPLPDRNMASSHPGRGRFFLPAGSEIYLAISR